MRRLDNLTVTLDAIHKVHPIEKPPRVLDLGAGTGSGAMAVGYWVYRNLGITIEQSTVFSVEPAIPMRRMAYFLMSAFYQKLHNLKENNDMFYMWHPCRAITIEEATWLSHEEEFDVILFCHTFSAETPEYRRRTLENVIAISKHLDKNGTLIFLTPRIQSKQDLMEEVKQNLLKESMVYTQPGIEAKTRIALSKHPESIIRLRRHKVDPIVKTVRSANLSYAPFLCQQGFSS